MTYATLGCPPLVRKFVVIDVLSSYRSMGSDEEISSKLAKSYSKYWSLISSVNQSETYPDHGCVNSDEVVMPSFVQSWIRITRVDITVKQHTLVILFSEEPPCDNSAIIVRC